MRAMGMTLLLVSGFLVSGTDWVRAEGESPQNAWSRFEVGSWVVFRHTLKGISTPRINYLKYVIKAITKDAVEVACLEEWDGEFVDKGQIFHKPYEHLHDRIPNGFFWRDVTYPGRLEFVEVAGKMAQIVVEVFEMAPVSRIDTRGIPEPWIPNPKAEFGSPRATVWRSSAVKLPLCLSCEESGLPAGAIKIETTGYG